MTKGHGNAGGDNSGQRRFRSLSRRENRNPYGESGAVSTRGFLMKTSRIEVTIKVNVAAILFAIAAIISALK